MFVKDKNILKIRTSPCFKNCKNLLQLQVIVSLLLMKNLVSNAE